MEIIAAVAIGLNPYIGAFVLLTLAAFTARVPETALLAAVPNVALVIAVTCFGLIAPVDFVLGKLLRFAPRSRRLSQYVAPLAAGPSAALVGQSDLPAPLVAAGAAAVAWGVATMITAFAARGSRSAAWVGLGHVPILMGAATAAACIVPLGLANPTLGVTLALIALATLVVGTVAGRRVTQSNASLRAVPAHSR